MIRVECNYYLDIVVVCEKKTFYCLYLPFLHLLFRCTFLKRTYKFYSYILLKTYILNLNLIFLIPVKLKKKIKSQIN